MPLINTNFNLIHFSKNNIPCDFCFSAKHKHFPRLTCVTTFTKCFGLIHMDILGAYFIPSILRHKCFLSMVDDNISFCWIYLMKQNSKTLNLVKYFIALIQSKFQTTIKTTRTYNGHNFLYEKLNPSIDFLH